VSIEMPPLRERKDDIVPLANTFIRRFAGELKKKIDGLEPDAHKLLMRYNWPGNIRELENTIERAMLLAEGRAIASVDLRLGEVPTAGGGRDQAPVVKIPPTGIALEDIERHALIEALKMSNWVQKDAAELLSISPRVMNYKIKTLQIEFPRGRRAADRFHTAPEPSTPLRMTSYRGGRLACFRYGIRSVSRSFLTHACAFPRL
jgi:DNA-binding NtrC family response regulator